MNIEERTHLGRSTADLPITYRGVVFPWHCDHTGHMNAMAYAGRFDEASWQLLSLFGLTSHYFRKYQRIVATVQQETTFNRELSPGDLIEIRSRMLEIRETALRVYHEMLHIETNETVAVSTSTEAHLDGATRKPCPLPPEIQRRSPHDGATASPRALEFGFPGQW